MKKIIFIILGLVSLVSLNIESINAVTSVCEYDFDTSNPGNELIVTFDDAGTASINQDFYPKLRIPNILNALVNVNSGQIKSTETLDFQVKELFGTCPENLYVCQYSETSSESGILNLFSDEHGIANILNFVYIKYSENEMNEVSNLKDLPNQETVWGSEFIDAWNWAYKGCSNYNIPVLKQLTGGLCGIGWDLVTYFKGIYSTENVYIKYKDCRNAAYTGDGPTYNLACPNLNVYLGRFQNAIKEYSSDSCINDASCKSRKISEVNEQENMIRNYCNTIMSSHNFDNGNEEDCLKACIDINIQLRKAKEQAGILKSGSGDCGFSGRLLVWLNNIMRWIKYILPVIVILLGIVDFIKAIAADKDDEMKKAQGRFVKRLISAAIVFLVPLLIEFILNIMGFKYDSCSLF